MKKIKLVVLLCFVALFAVSCTLPENTKETPLFEPERPYVAFQTDSGEVLVNVEVVDTPETRAVGLMFREELEENAGMLFIFEETMPLSFWMKNTLIPLDMIFIDENWTIIDIHYAIPCEADPCRTYVSQKPGRYVVEVNGGFTGEKNILVGNTISFSVATS